jgi:hypothetical protein
METGTVNVSQFGDIFDLRLQNCSFKTHTAK